MKSKSVAVLMATKDGERFLKTQIVSILNQTHKNLKIYIGDDSSQDSSEKIINSFSIKYPNKIFFRRVSFGNYSKNFFNLVNDKSIDADFYAFSDQDDIWLPDKIENALNSIIFIEESTPILYGSRTRLINEKGYEVGISPLFKIPPSFNNALVQNIMGGNTMVFNKTTRALIQSLEHDCLFPYDWLMYIIVSGAEGKVIYDKKPSVLYRQHKNNLIGNNHNFVSKFLRFKRLINREYKTLNKLLIRILNKNIHILGLNQRETLKVFSTIHYSKSPILRANELRKMKFFRQTIFGRFSFYFAVIFGLI